MSLVLRKGREGNVWVIKISESKGLESVFLGGGVPSTITIGKVKMQVQIWEA